MPLEVPAPLRQEHEALHQQLHGLTQAEGPVGEAAREVARRLHPHFVREEAFAMPPLGLLASLAGHEALPEPSLVLAMTRQLEAEMPAMLAEHRHTVEALEQLRRTAREAGRPDAEAFADALVLHAQTEEQVLYPAALLVGEVVQRRLGMQTGNPA